MPNVATKNIPTIERIEIEILSFWDAEQYHYQMLPLIRINDDDKISFHLNVQTRSGHSEEGDSVFEHFMDMEIAAFDALEDLGFMPGLTYHKTPDGIDLPELGGQYFDGHGIPCTVRYTFLNRTAWNNVEQLSE